MTIKLEYILEKMGFCNQKYEYCIYNRQSRVYVFTSIVVKVKRNVCWLTKTPNSFNICKIQTLEQSLNILNDYIDYDHGQQLVIRKNSINDVMIYKNYANSIYTYILDSTVKQKIKCQILNRLFNMQFSYVKYTYIWNYTIENGHAFISNKYIIYDVDSSNFIVDVNKSNSYFISDIELICL